MGFKIFEQLIKRKDGKQNNMQTESMKNQDYNSTVMETLSVAYREAQLQDPEICLLAVKKDYHVLKEIENQTEEICLEAVRNNECVLQFVKQEFKQICENSLKNDDSGLAKLTAF